MSTGSGDSNSTVRPPSGIANASLEACKAWRAIKSERLP